MVPEDCPVTMTLPALSTAIASDHVPSVILWGPPGVGKTTLARLVAGAVDAQFIVLSAVLAGVKDIREAVERAQAQRAQGRGTVVFVDEVHRFNKAQQDAFLPHVESGLFTFIGATTENPSFEVNSALLSRATVYVLKSLTDEDMVELLDDAQRAVDGRDVECDDQAIGRREIRGRSHFTARADAGVRSGLRVRVARNGRVS